MVNKDFDMQSAYPLSPLQMGMLYHALSEPSSGVDIEQILFTLHESLDLSVWEHAWTALLQRHDILRTRFRWEDVDEPVQIVEPAVPVQIVVEEWPTADAEERERRLRELLRTDRATDFHLAQAPLMRFRCIRLGEEGTYFLWTFHHALLDGRSFPILIEEVFQLYEAAKQNQTAQLPPVRQYRDYIDWVCAQDFDRTQSFWQEQLHGFRMPTPFGIDVDRERAAALPCGYQEQECRLTVEETVQLEEFSRRHSLTPNTVLMGAWALLLARYTGETDIVFGGTRACRASALPGARTMAGLFINTVPVRIGVDEDQGVVGWLQQLRDQWVRLREYEHTPLSKIQAWSPVERGQPLFESIVVFESFLLNSRMRSLGGAWLKREFQYFGQTNFPLTLIGYHDHALLVIAGYDQRRFGETTIRRLLGHLRTLLVGLTAASEQRLGDVPHLTSAEANNLVGARNRTQDYTVTECLHEWFTRQAIRQPNAVAVADAGLLLTYRELDLRANQLAQHLVGLGVGPDTLVALYLERSLDMVVAILGVLKAGGAYLPLDMAYPKERLTFMLEDAQPPVLVTQQQLVDALPATPGLQTIVIDRDWEQIRQQPGIAPMSDVRPEHLAYVIYTSGSTGKPKGCMITHANVVRLFLATEAWYRFGEDDVWTLFHSYAFDFSVWELWGALLYGGKLIVVPYGISRSPEAFYELLVQERVTVLNQTPSAFGQLMGVEERGEVRGHLSLRYVIFGGEALELQSLRGWFDRHGDERPLLINMYGITETTVHVTYRPIRQADLDAGTGSVIGVPIPDLEIYLLDSRGRPVPEGVIGEIYVGGAGVACGYLKRPELTATRFVDHPYRPGTGARLYRSGDLGRWVGEQDLEYLGRADDQVKVRGFRIELGEIESVLCTHPGIQKAVVLVRAEPGGGKRLLAYYVRRSGQIINVSELREHVKCKLPDYMVPAAFVRIDDIPLTTNGKVDRNALPEPEVERPDLATRYEAPRAPVEETLARIWAEVLRVERIGIHDNFFELGGDSILSIQLVARARRAGIAIRPRDLFKHATIAELATLALPTVSTVPQASPIPDSDVPLTPIQRWFFELRSPVVNHYNQSFLFEVVPVMEASHLQEVLDAIQSRHEALRYRYQSTSDGWRQWVAPQPGPALLRWHDLSALPADQTRLWLQALANEAPSTLDIEQGPLWRADYFKLGSQGPDRLLLTVHHLAVDGVSWRILLEDLDQGLAQRERGQPVELAAETTSFTAWARCVCDWAASPTARAAVAHWRNIVAPVAAPMPRDLGGPAINTEGDTDCISVALTAEETAELLHKVPAALNTRILEVLLTALAETLGQWTGSSLLSVDVEGHGREEFGEDVDVSRTVGWFTAIYPVSVELPASLNLRDRVRRVRQYLDALPLRGASFSALRYMHADAGMRKQLAAWSNTEVLFNYLGQFDQILPPSNRFRFAAGTPSAWRSPKTPRAYWIEIDGWVRDGQLQFSWKFHRHVHQQETMARVASRFQAALQQIIGTFSQAPINPLVSTRSQFSPDLNEQLRSRYSSLQDVYQLTPMQGLFCSLGALAGHQVWHFQLSGPVDLVALRRAWEEIHQRHTALRTAFITEDVPHPLQVVVQTAALPWDERDLRSLPADQQTPEINATERDAQTQPLHLATAPLSRVTLLRVRDDEYHFFWTSHHLIVDGWSWPLILQEVVMAYNALLRNETPCWEPTRPFRAYVDWLLGESESAAESFWRHYLRGKTSPTRVTGPTTVAALAATVPSIGEVHVPVPTSIVTRLNTIVRSERLTLNTILLGAWALVVHQLSSDSDVLLGATFSGRPAELDGIEGMVGSFVNNLPVRATIRYEQNLLEWLRDMGNQLLEIQLHQTTPLARMHAWSEIPSRHRLFDTLFVLQNYIFDPSAFRAVDGTAWHVLTAPEVSHYALTALAVPQPEFQLRLLFERRHFGDASGEKIVQAWLAILNQVTLKLDTVVGDLMTVLHHLAPERAQPPVPLPANSHNGLPAVIANDLELRIVRLWQEAFDVENIGVDDNFFDLGGHSVLLVRVHCQLQQALGCNIPIVKLFQYPTIRSLARFLSHSDDSPATAPSLATRPSRQQTAMARQRQIWRKGS